MRQQVNLLAPMFRKQRALFSSRVSLAICGLVAGVLVLIYLAASWRGASLTSEQARLEQTRETITRRLNDLASQFKGKASSSELVEQTKALTLERDRKAQALAALSRRELGNSRGFSPHFLGLARQRLNGLWLTRVELDASGAHVALQGVTLSEELIPEYLRKLGSEEVFAGTQFEHAQLERVSEGGNQLRFELRTRSAGSGAGSP
jgi:hypothetical protein